MSEMTLFSKGGNTLPAHLQNLQLDATTKALMGGSGNGGGKRISIRGNVFRMMVDGKEIAQNEDRAMPIIIAAANPNVSRTFYAGVYQEGQAMAPTCWSNDGVSPDIKAEAPQSGKCATCSQNIKGSGQGDSRACRFSQRLAVLLENDIRGDVYQLTLPAQSIFGAVENGKMPLQAYAKFLGSHGLPVTAVVTEMRFDEDSTVGKLFFRPVRFLEKDEWEVAKKQGETKTAKSAITMTVAQVDGVKKLEAPAVKAEAGTVEVIAEPTKRADKKAAEPAPKRDLKAVMGDWSNDDAA
jgi:hypothetical protein